MHKRQVNKSSLPAETFKEKHVKHSKQSILKFSQEDLRWATHELVAGWRAKRMQCSKAADVGCGIGFQAFSLAHACSSVVALDSDASKVETAKANAAKLGLNNISFLAADALSDEALQLVSGCDAVFLDPEREVVAKERKITRLSPPINQFLERYSAVTSEIAIEFPPQIQEFPLGCEREYASIGGKLNRLTLYFGRLKKSDVSAVALPAGAVIVKNNNASLRKADSAGRYLYEADHAVQKAGLLAELCETTGARLLEVQKRALFTSDNEISSPFFKESYQVIEVCSLQFKDVINHLKKHGFGKVLVRYEVAPQEYWNERMLYESQLFGERQATLFKIRELAVICTNLT